MDTSQFFFVRVLPKNNRPYGKTHGPYADKSALVTAMSKISPDAKCIFLVFQGAFLLHFDPNDLPTTLPARPAPKLRLVEKIPTVPKETFAQDSDKKCDKCQTELITGSTRGPYCPSCCKFVQGRSC